MNRFDRLVTSGDNGGLRAVGIETVQVNVGLRCNQTDFTLDTRRTWADETFKITLRNHKKDVVEIRVVEHLYCGLQWKITSQSQDFEKTDSRTIEFPVTIEPDKEAVVTYTVHYTW